MTEILRYVLELGVSTLGSLIGVGLWFHFDLEGKMEHRKHARIIRRGERLDKRR